MARFLNRRDAGTKLAQKLVHYANQPNVIVLALPRGGVPVGYEVARALNIPLDVFIVRKLGLPGHEELAIGALASGGVRVLNDDIIRMLSIPQEVIDRLTQRELQELQRREKLYRGEQPAPQVHDRTAILVDDGLATGATMEAAILAVRQSQPARVVGAAPVGAADTCRRLAVVADEVVCVATPEPFQAVGLWYERFDQTSDDEVIELLRLGAAR